MQFVYRFHNLMLVSDFDYQLPQDLIAQHPPTVRGESRMMTLDRKTGNFQDKKFTDLPDLLSPGDLLVLNDSRVIPARLFAKRDGLRTQQNSPAPSAAVEVLLIDRIASTYNDWRVLVRPAKKILPGEKLSFISPHTQTVELRAAVLSAGESGTRTLRFDPVDNFNSILDRIGHLPLPPYIQRTDEYPNTAEDRERYQTVFARERGSVAAPTAGLHFTDETLERLRQKGVDITYLTLHVGLGTFQSVRAETTENIRLHAERFTLTHETALKLEAARQCGRRIIAVGTTTTRTLEHIAREAEQRNEPIKAQSGNTSLFLYPGEAFKLVTGLLTNFHLPQSTLLMLVSAFAGKDHTLAAYAHAVKSRYQFFSYGDCMLIL
jgi:S-adenosylmethionine:tRNA ribosyltransferase-isomerase